MPRYVELYLERPAQARRDDLGAPPARARERRLRGDAQGHRRAQRDRLLKKRRRRKGAAARRPASRREALHQIDPGPHAASQLTGPASSSSAALVDVVVVLVVVGCVVDVVVVLGEMRTEPATGTPLPPRMPRRRGAAHPASGDELLIRGERGAVLQMLTSSCLEQFAAECRDGLMFHAAAVAKVDQAMLLPAESGTGKTILTAWLCDRGFALLSDEAVFLPRRSKQVEPFRRFLDVKASGRHALSSFIDLDDPRILRTPDGFLIPPAVVRCAEAVNLASVSAICSADIRKVHHSNSSRSRRRAPGCC